MNKSIGIIGRIVFWLGLIYIVGHAALFYYTTGEIVTVGMALIFFPFTFFLYPWFHGLWWIFVISIIGYWLSTFFGNMDLVD